MQWSADKPHKLVVFGSNPNGRTNNPVSHFGLKEQ